MKTSAPVTADLAQLRLRLNPRFTFLLERGAAGTFCQVANGDNSKFFRLGAPEYLFLSLFDGGASLAEAVTLAARRLGPDSLTEDEAAELCRWGLQQGLLLPAGVPDVAGGSQPPTEWFSLFWWKVPLGSPDGLLLRLQPWLGWLLSPAAGLLTLLLMLVAGLTLAHNWARWLADSQSLWDPQQWWRLGAAWLGLKIVHELAHGLACRRYGGAVREMGMALVLLAPMAYVDVSSSWQFRSRWQRMHVAAAGMWIELLLASLGVLVWSQTTSRETAHWMVQIVTMAGVSTLLFNLNPLMRFDGYYLLSDLLEIPNLAQSGATYVNSLWRRQWLGDPPVQLPEQGWRGVVVRIYGVAAGAWRVMVSITLLATASVLWHGFGIVLSAIGLLTWCGQPLLAACRAVGRQWGVDPRPVLLGAGKSALLAAVLAYGLILMPCPGGIGAPAVVEYADRAVLRAAVAGFVARVHVDAESVVNAGDILLELVNDDLQLEALEMRIAIRQSALRHKAFLQQQKPGAALVEARNAEALHSQLQELERQLEALIIRAPRAGRVLTPHLSELRGVWVEPGRELISIGSEDRKELVAAVRQEDLEAFRGGLQQDIQVRLPLRRLVEGKLSEVAPQATTTEVPESLLAPNGGPLAVRTRPNSTGESATYELLTPQFVVKVALPTAAAKQLAAGERGNVRLMAERPPVAVVLYRLMEQWVRDVVRRAEHKAA